MAFGNYEFPNSAFYDGDLRELVRLYKDLMDKYNNIQNQIQEALDYINTFDDTVDDKIRDAIAVEMSLYLQRLLKVETQIEALEKELNTFETATRANIDSLSHLIIELRADLTALQSDMFQRIENVIELFHEFKNGITSMMDGERERLEQYIIENVTHLDRLDVINPITGLFEGIQKVLNQIVDMFQFSFALTAREYDELQLSAWEYDKLRITALEYSTRAYFIFWDKRQGMMRNPFTGLMTSFETVITKLCDFHRYALTAKQYDALQLTAKAYDDKQITAFNYDWRGRLYLDVIAEGRAITAEIYKGLTYDPITGAVNVPKELIEG